MKGVVWFVLLSLVCNMAYAVKKSEPPKKTTITEINALIKKSEYYVLKRPDSAQKIAERALVLSKKINYKHGIGECFQTIGIAYWVQSVFPVSQFYLSLSIPYLQGDKIALSRSYQNIARNYVEFKDYKNARFNFGYALKMVGNDIAHKAEIYTELTSLLNASGDYEDALMHIGIALKYSHKANKTGLIAILYDRLGQIYISREQLDLAQRTLDTCSLMALLVKNKRLNTVLMIDQARLFVLKNDLTKAGYLANKGYLLADTLGSFELRIRALKVISQINQKQGNTKIALQMQSKINQIYENVKDFNNSKTLQLIQDYSDLNDKLNKIEVINKNSIANEQLIKTQHRTIALLVVSLITAITFLIVIFIYFRQKNQLNHQLQVQHQVLTKQKQLIELQRTDLEVVSKLKDKLLAIIGHDLRTPIANLSSITDLFAVDCITADEVIKLMRDLTPVIKGAELTLSNLTEFASSQIKGQSVAASNINMFLIGAEMKATFEHQLIQKNIKFSNEFLPETNIWADANHIKVIMRNLVSNAIKFTNNSGVVKVSSSITGNEVAICVSDNGVGMTNAEVEQLFDSNEHHSQYGTLGEKGTGLGLLLCKELVELNKGKMWVESTPAKGCNFYFSMPMSGVEV